MCLNLVKVWVFCWWFCNLFCCGNLFFVPFWLVLWDPISGFWHLDSLELNFTLVCWFLAWNSYTHYWSCDIGMMVQYCRLIMWGIFFYHPYAFHGNLQRLLSFLWDANCVEMWNYACSSWRILMGWIVFLDLGCQFCWDVRLCMQKLKDCDGVNRVFGLGMLKLYMPRVVAM